MIDKIEAYEIFTDIDECKDLIEYLLKRGMYLTILRCIADYISLSYKCKKCGMTSYNTNDVVNRYCGNCNEFEVL